MPHSLAPDHEKEASSVKDTSSREATGMQKPSRRLCSTSSSESDGNTAVSIPTDQMPGAKIPRVGDPRMRSLEERKDFRAGGARIRGSARSEAWPEKREERGPRTRNGWVLRGPHPVTDAS